METLSQQVRLVLVEDNPSLLAALTFAFEVEGYTVFAHESAKAALDSDVGDAACLVIDYRLPDLDGLELLQRLRQGGVEAPAILITGRPGEALKNRVAVMNVVLVEKPLLSNELLEAVRTAVGRPKPVATDP